MKLDARKIVDTVTFVKNVAEAGGPMKVAEAVDDRAYHRGVKDGKRIQKSKDVPKIAAAAAAAALLSQVPHLLALLSKNKAKKEKKKREEDARIEVIRAELERRMKENGGTLR